MRAFLLFIVLFGLAPLRNHAAVLDFSSHETYKKSRATFRLACARSLAVAASFPVASHFDSDLTIETAWLPALQSPRNLFVLVGGLHGIEAPVGSAVENVFFNKVLPGLNRDHLGILVVHAANPYGFQYGRRVNESNIDLNRNFALDSGLFSTPNTSYERLSPLLNPRSPAKASGFVNALFSIQAGYYLTRYSMATVRQAVLQGQYQNPRGVYFGGQALAPETEILMQLIHDKAHAYDNLYVVALHTGYGERGRLHFFPSQISHPASERATKDLFAGYEVDYSTSEIAYPTHGDFIDYVVAKYSDKQRVVAMTFEYGTLDSQTISGSIRSIHRLVQENQGFHHGYKNERDRIKIESQFREMFFPQSEEWRSSFLRTSEAVLRDTLGRFAD